MANDADIADVLIEHSTNINVSAIRGRITGAGQDYCEDCGDDLSAERRKAAPWAIRCVPCAGVYERKSAYVR